MLFSLSFYCVFLLVHVRVRKDHSQREELARAHSAFYFLFLPLLHFFSPLYIPWFPFPETQSTISYSFLFSFCFMKINYFAFHYHSLCYKDRDSASSQRKLWAKMRTPPPPRPFLKLPWILTGYWLSGDFSTNFNLNTQSWHLSPLLDILHTMFWEELEDFCGFLGIVWLPPFARPGLSPVCVCYAQQGSKWQDPAVTSQSAFLLRHPR